MSSSVLFIFIVISVELVCYWYIRKPLIFLNIDFVSYNFTKVSSSVFFGGVVGFSDSKIMSSADRYGVTPSPCAYLLFLGLAWVLWLGLPY